MTIIQRPETKSITPEEALLMLKEGNFRFVNNMQVHKDLLSAVHQTRDGQHPYAAILSCMDSRTSVELIFDQGVGDVFSIRIAGNVVTDDVLGSLEFAVAVAGVKLILVLGHTNCGAIKGACDHVQLGHLTSLLERIKPALNKEQMTTHDRTSHNVAFVDSVARLNVVNSIEEILQRSDIIRDAAEGGKLAVEPAVYDVANGIVMFSGFAGYKRPLR